MLEGVVYIANGQQTSVPEDTILITGGLGYIGSAVCVAALSRKYPVLLIDNFLNSGEHVLSVLEGVATQHQAKLYFLCADLSDHTHIRATIGNLNSFQAVVHCAYDNKVASTSDYILNNVKFVDSLAELVSYFKIRTVVYPGLQLNRSYDTEKFNIFETEIGYYEKLIRKLDVLSHEYPEEETPKDSTTRETLYDEIANWPNSNEPHNEQKRSWSSEVKRAWSTEFGKQIKDDKAWGESKSWSEEVGKHGRKLWNDQFIKNDDFGKYVMGNGDFNRKEPPEFGKNTGDDRNEENRPTRCRENKSYFTEEKPDPWRLGNDEVPDSNLPDTPMLSSMNEETWAKYKAQLTSRPPAKIVAPRLLEENKSTSDNLSPWSRSFKALKNQFNEIKKQSSVKQTPYKQTPILPSYQRVLEATELPTAAEQMTPKSVENDMLLLREIVQTLIDPSNLGASKKVGELLAQRTGGPTKTNLAEKLSEFVEASFEHNAQKYKFSEFIILQLPKVMGRVPGITPLGALWNPLHDLITSRPSNINLCPTDPMRWVGLNEISNHIVDLIAASSPRSYQGDWVPKNHSKMCVRQASGTRILPATPESSHYRWYLKAGSTVGCYHFADSSKLLPPSEGFKVDLEGLYSGSAPDNYRKVIIHSPYLCSYESIEAHLKYGRQFPRIIDYSPDGVVLGQDPEEAFSQMAEYFRRDRKTGAREASGASMINDNAVQV